ncbi:MAG: hypothetical protein C4308_14060 [Chitinophagaceae bacterium]
MVSRRNFSNLPSETVKLKKIIEGWKLKYFNDTEIKDRQINELRSQLSAAKENLEILEVELEEVRKHKRKAEPDPVSIHKAQPSTTRPDYVEQLRQAQLGLATHQQKIEQLLESIDVIAETEEKQKEFELEREQLLQEAKELKYLLSQREAELTNLKQQQSLSKEMTSMLDSAYSEFNTLQSKIHSLETQLSASKMTNIEYEDLKENFYKVSRDLEEQKLKLHASTLENQQLTLQLNETEDKLREANFQRQQLQKRVAYLEELNTDLQLVAAANKKLEHQLRRIGELESMLNVVSEERDELLKKQSQH